MQTATVTSDTVDQIRAIARTVMDMPAASAPRTRVVCPSWESGSTAPAALELLEEATAGQQRTRREHAAEQQSVHDRVDEQSTSHRTQSSIKLMIQPGTGILGGRVPSLREDTGRLWAALNSLSRHTKAPQRAGLRVRSRS
jgi:hypothetical protein